MLSTILRARMRVPFGSTPLDDLLVLDWRAFISMQLSVETVLSRIAHCLSRKMSMRLLLPRVEKSMFNLVIGVDNSLEFLDKVKAFGSMGGLILAKQVE